MRDKVIISVVSPVYRGEKMVGELVRRNVEALRSITDDYEIILVNDASPDESWREIEKECAKNPKVKGLNLSRNFGQHYAITAGLAYATGEWIVVMDCDLQDQPEEIPNIYNKAISENLDIVSAKRVVKHVGWWKRFSSVLFYAVFGWISGKKTDPSIAHFGIYAKKVIDVYNNVPQQSRSFGTLIDILGFRRGYYEVEQNPRLEGKSSYTLYKLLKLSFDIMIVNTNKPLRIAVGLGFTMSALSFLLAVYQLFARWMGIVDFPGFTTTVFSIWFVGGLLLFVMGILGLYIGKIFDQVKGHPLFIVNDKLNLD